LNILPALHEDVAMQAMS